MKITSTLIIALAISGISEARLLGKKKSKKGGGASDIVVDNRVGAIKTGGGGSNKAGGGGGGSKFRDPKLAPGIPPGTVWPGDESTNVDNRGPGQSTDGDCCNGEAGPQPPSGQDSAGNRVGGCEVPDTGFKPTFSIAKKAEGFTLNNYITGVPRDFECECNDQCAVQDGTSKICCFKSHYFIGEDNQNIKLCVDLTGITEAAMSGCIVTPEEEPVLVGDVLDVALPVLSRPGVDVDPNK
jgi:hypothetical protein